MHWAMFGWWRSVPIINCARQPLSDGVGDNGNNPPLVRACPDEAFTFREAFAQANDGFWGVAAWCMVAILWQAAFPMGQGAFPL